MKLDPRLAIISLVIITFACRSKISSEKQPEAMELPAIKTPDAPRIIEEFGGFSYVPPENWIIKKETHLLFQICVEPIDSNMASGIQITKGRFIGTLDDYVKGITLNDNLKPTVLDQRGFKTSDGLDGIRMVRIRTINDVVYRQINYFFIKSDTYYCIICSTFPKGGEKYDAIFDGCATSFRLEKP